MNTRRILNYETLQIDGMTFAVLTKDVRNLSMRVSKRKGLTITRPLGISMETVVEFARKNSEWARKYATQFGLSDDGKPDETESRGLVERPYSPEERHAFMARVARIFPACEGRMRLYASKLTIRLMKSQWGSCKKSTRAISLNLALARRSDECLEYVIIHELAHIVHANHGPEFWALVEEYCPDWRRRRALLRDRC